MMKDPFGGILLNIAFRMLVPFTLVYAVYVLVLGETSPGGGFQAGVVMGFGIVLARLILGERATIFNIQMKNSLVFGNDYLSLQKKGSKSGNSGVQLFAPVSFLFCL